MKPLHSLKRLKSLKKALKLLISPFTLGLAVTAFMGYTSVDYYAHRATLSKDDHSLTAFIQQIHEKTIDWRLTDRGPILGSDRVAILAIDERAIEQEGRFPWPRDKVAKLVEKTLDSGAKIVAFDIIFSESDQNSSIPTLRKLKRGLAGRQQLSNDASGLIEREILSTDGDRIFSDMIKRRANQLVLGAYFDPASGGSPYKEFCYDALFERTYESRYWKKEAIPLTVIDTPLNSIAFPAALKSHIADYATVLEITSANGWFDQRPHLIPRIRESLDEFENLIGPEVYPGLGALWINNDLDTVKDLLTQIKPEFASDEGARTLLSKYGDAFTKQEAASLVQDVRAAGRKYCQTFLTSEDPLLNFEKYKLDWPIADVEDQFKAHSLQEAWTKIQTSRQPAEQTAAINNIESIDAAVARIQKTSLSNNIQNVDRWWISIPLLGDVTRHTGFFNAKQDTDGSIRRSMLISRYGNAYMPSLALKTFLLDKGLTSIVKIDSEEVGRSEVAAKVLRHLDILDKDGNSVMTVPVDGHGQLMINYSGGRNMFPYVSAADLLSDSDELLIETQELETSSNKWRMTGKKVKRSEFLKDRLLIVGATAVGLYDLRVTPFEENFPGIETHANVLSNLLSEHAAATNKRSPASAAPGFLRTHPSEERVMWMILLGIGLIFSALLSYFGSVAGLGITAVAMTGVYGIDRFWLFGSGIVTTILFPQLQIFGTFVTLTFYKYFTEERKKRELKGTFEKYVSPAIVAEVLSDPENIELGGKKVPMTVMFSDVRGFTTISEKLDPRELSDLLNSYLTPMTDLVFKNKGTLDKYMGDAIMSFWGAPIHFPDHAIHACRCALQMIEKLKELQEQYRAKGLPEIDIGIGLNTGDMSVGNMGSDTVRSYTVMGDAVNLGSRLEGINKQYGTRIIVSEFTQAEIKDKFVTREVDWVRVKGKAQPVRIFELIAEGDLPAPRQELLRWFEKGFQLYHEKQFTEAISAFREALNIDAEDPVSILYVERCEDYLKEPPPENWDGVFTMTSK